MGTISISPLIELGVPLFAVLVTGGCAFYIVLARPRAPGARAFAVVLMLETAWVLGYLAELWATDLEGMVFWDGLQLVPSLALPFGLMVFAFDYRGRRPRHHELFGLLAIPPVIACVWVLSDPLHGAARASAVVIPDPTFDRLHYEYTNIELFAYWEGLFLSGYSALVVFAHSRRQAPIYRRQAFAVWAGVALCVAALALLLALPFEVRILGQRDSSPLWFGLSGLLVTFGLSRYGLFDLSPVAHEVLFEQMADPVFVFDCRDRLIDLNPAAAELLPHSSPIGAVASEAFRSWPELRETFAAAGGSLPRRGALAREVHEPDGARVFSFEVTPLCVSRRPGHAILLRDITLRKQRSDELERRVAERTSELRSQVDATRLAQAEAEASEQKFRAILNGAYGFIGMLDPSGTILAANKAALELMDADEDEVIGRPLWESPWWPREGSLRSEVRDGVERAARGEFVRFETRKGGLNDGPLAAFDFSFSPIRASDESVRAIVAEGRDVSDRYRAEQEKSRLEARLQTAERLEAIGRLAGGVAHDFNNLLTVILGNVQLARLRGDGRDQRGSFLDVIEQAATSAASLARQLLTFARKGVSEPQIVDLNELARKIEPLLGRLLGEDIDVVLELSAELGSTRMDPAVVEQIVVNLAVNARDAMHGGGRLTISTAEVDRERPEELPVVPEEARESGASRFVALFVRDEGVGMSEEIKTHAFEPFFTTKPKGEGTGLGLAMVYGAVKQAGGFIEVDSAPGKGTTIGIFLPRTEREATREGRGIRAKAARGGERIVLVEDAPLVRSTVRQQLEGLGYQVAEFEGADGARRYLADSKNEVDMLITDVVLADASGRQLAEELRANRPSLRVVYMSGYTDDVVLRHGITRGSVVFLEKPFSIEKLGAAIRRAIDGGAAAPEESGPHA